jgi:hypothetical protein
MNGNESDLYEIVHPKIYSLTKAQALKQPSEMVPWTLSHLYIHGNV